MYPKIETAISRVREPQGEALPPLGCVIIVTYVCYNLFMNLSLRLYFAMVIIAYNNMVYLENISYAMRHTFVTVFLWNSILLKVV